MAAFQTSYLTERGESLLYSLLSAYLGLSFNPSYKSPPFLCVPISYRLLSFWERLGRFSGRFNISYSDRMRQWIQSIEYDHCFCTYCWLNMIQLQTDTILCYNTPKGYSRKFHIDVFLIFISIRSIQLFFVALFTEHFFRRLFFCGKKHFGQLPSATPLPYSNKKLFVFHITALLKQLMRHAHWFSKSWIFDQAAVCSWSRRAAISVSSGFSAIVGP